MNSTTPNLNRSLLSTALATMFVYSAAFAKSNADVTAELTKLSAPETAEHSLSFVLLEGVVQIQSGIAHIALGEFAAFMENLPDPGPQQNNDMFYLFQKDEHAALTAYFLAIAGVMADQPRGIFTGLYKKALKEGSLAFFSELADSMKTHLKVMVKLADDQKHLTADYKIFTEASGFKSDAYKQYRDKLSILQQQFYDESAAALGMLHGVANLVKAIDAAENGVPFMGMSFESFAPQKAENGAVEKAAAA